MLSLEWRFVSLGGYGDFYVELSVLDSGKVMHQTCKRFSTVT